MKRIVESGSQTGASTPVQHRFADLGMREHPSYPLGITGARAITYTTRNPKTDNPVHLTVVDFPVNGLGLEYALKGIAPAKTGVALFERIGREDTVDDWKLPDEAEEKFENEELHARHMKIPSYATFHESHRRKWMKKLKKTKYDRLFTSVWETRFIEPQTFANASFTTMRKDFETWKAEHPTGKDNYYSPAYNIIEPLLYITPKATWDSLEQFLYGKVTEELEAAGPAADPRRRELQKILRKVSVLSQTDEYKYQKYIALRKEYPIEFFEVYLNTIGAAPLALQMDTIINSYFHDPRVILIDPATGNRWTSNTAYNNGRKPEIERNSVSFSLQGMNAAFETKHGSARLQLGEVKENGEYAITKTEFTFPDKYRKKGLLPLIAWEETPEGRKILKQDEAVGLLLEDMRDPRLDVMLGTVFVAHGQPEVAAKFPEKMGIPQEADKQSRGRGRQHQDMMAAQMPVLIHFPQIEKRLLAGLPVDLGVAA